MCSAFIATFDEPLDVRRSEEARTGFAWGAKRWAEAACGHQTRQRALRYAQQCRCFCACEQGQRFGHGPTLTVCIVKCNPACAWFTRMG